MSTKGEIIALLLGESSERPWRAERFSAGAQRLVRDSSGRVSLEAIGSQEEFDHAARNTGCFRRGNPIIDPETREVIGYEMEEVPLRCAALSA
jgi:hypothetical protein